MADREREERLRKGTRYFTYIYCGDAFEFTVIVDEAWTVTTKDLLNSCASEFYRRNHDRWLVILGTGCTTTIIVSVTSLKLAHLLKSIVILTTASLGFRV